MAPTHAAAYCCGRKGCGGYRFAYLTVANNEPLECAKCGSAFPKRTQMMPLPRERRRAASTSGKGKGKENVKGKGTGQDNSKGKSMKGYGKGGGSAGREESRRPWRRPTSSTPAQPPEDAIRIQAKRLQKDLVHKWQKYTEFATKAGDDEFRRLAEANLEAALRQKAAAMPPAQRVEHLRKRLRAAEEELARRSRQVDATEAEIDILQSRHKQEVESRDDFSSKLDDLREELQEAEAILPKPLGLRRWGVNYHWISYQAAIRDSRSCLPSCMGISTVKQAGKCRARCARSTFRT